MYGKTIRDIAKEARMSIMDIGSILNKADEGREQNNNNNDIENKKQQQGQEQQQLLSLSTQAYKLFSEGKSPIQVAVALNVRVRDNQILQRILEAKPNERSQHGI
jgi:hypothetical protein